MPALQGSPSTSRRWLPWLIATGVALTAVAAATLDVRVAGWVHARDLGPHVKAAPWAHILKLPGHFGYCTLPVAAIVALVSRTRWRGATLVCLSGITSGLLYTLAKWSAGRTRPFPKNHPFVPPFELHPFNQGLAGLWRAENQAFPSGHTCLAFSTAAALGILFPRGRAAFLLIASAVGVERVLEGAHYPSDVVAGATFGLTAALLTDWILKRLWSDNHRDEQHREFLAAADDVAARPAGGPDPNHVVARASS